MKVEKLIIFVIFLGLIQLAACERSKITDPGPNSLREAADSLNPYPGDSLPLDSIYKPDTLVGGTDSLPNAGVRSVKPRRSCIASFILCFLRYAVNFLTTNMRS